MSKSELLLRERLYSMGGRTSKSETSQTTRVSQDDELDAVSGGAQRFKYEVGLQIDFTDIIVSS